MKTATGITLLAIGAILTFAVTANLWFFNIHIAGVVIMLAGLAGLFIPRRTYSSLNRRMVQRRTRTWPNGQVVETKETSYPPYVVTASPGAGPEQAGLPSVPSIPPDPPTQSVMTGEPGPGPRQQSGPSITPDPMVRKVMTPGATESAPGGGGEDEIIEQLRDD
jgi:hypothetical protein